MILTEHEVAQRLNKSGGPEATLDPDLVQIVWPAAEAMVQMETGRQFVETDWEVYLDIAPGQTTILTPDYPVIELDSLSAVTEVSDAGVRTLEDYEEGDYELDAAAGRISLRSGTFPTGLGRVKLVCTTGYAEEDLAANATPEILLLKSVILKIVQREWAINRDNKRHLRSHSYGEESATYNFDLTFDEQRAVAMLRRHGR